MIVHDSNDFSEIPVFRAGITCKCPRCGVGKLFSGFLTVAERCTVCDLDFTNVDSGDGPAVFVIMALGFLVTAGALIVEVAYQPPYWLHFVIWFPAILIGGLALLRPSKAMLIALQFKHQAKQHSARD